MALSILQISPFSFTHWQSNLAFPAPGVTLKISEVGRRKSVFAVVVIVSKITTMG